MITTHENFSKIYEVIQADKPSKILLGGREGGRGDEKTTTTVIKIPLTSSGKHLSSADLRCLPPADLM